MDLLDVNDTPGAYPASAYAAAAHAAAIPVRPSAAGELSCDVCIVGGGFTGLSSALHLARRGYDVVVLEAQRVGFGASGRNGGQVGRGQRADQDTLEAMVGRDHAAALWRIGEDAVALVRDLAATDAVHADFHPGIIHAEHRARDVAPLHAYAERLGRDHDVSDYVALDRDALRALCNSPAYHGGALDLGSGHIDPLQLALGMARLADAAGARIFETSRVRTLTRGDPFRADTDAARITARYGVLACNGYLGDLMPAVSARVMPINNYIVATAPLDPDRRRSVLTRNHAVADGKFVVNYFRFDDAGRLLFGGTESYGYRFPSDIAGKVRGAMLGIFPQLADVDIEQAWGGTLAITMSRMPHFARLDGNLLSMSGYSGHGVALATLAGQMAAEAIAGQAERFDVMAGVPSRPFPGGRMLRSPLLVLGMLWYGLRDRL